MTITTIESWAQQRADAWNTKCREVQNLAYLLRSNPVVALSEDTSDYGQEGWETDHSELTEAHATAWALHAWYSAKDLPIPTGHVLYQEAARIAETQVTAPDPTGGPFHGRGLTGLASDVRWAWSASTSADPDRYPAAQKSYGQCAVTALLVQQVAGGELLRVVVTDDFCGLAREPEEVSHYFNLLPDGTEVDLTRDQFSRFVYGENVTEPEARDRGYVLSHPATLERYKLLADRVYLPHLY